MQNTELNELVAAAKQKNSQALEELYKKTNHLAYYTALSILKNEEDAKDAVQDSYIHVFSSIDKIQENAFINYLKMAVANTCKNSLKQKKPFLFTTYEEEANALDSMEEQSEDFLPDQYIAQSAKRKQIMSIIEELSDVQRATILFFYFDEMSISQIAEVMECSESTVQSRIAYAKKHIKNEVLKLENRGDKIYGKAFLPASFLAKLFAEDSKNHVLPEAASNAIFHNVLSSPAVAGTASSGGLAASGLLAKLAGLSGLGKAVAVGIAAVAVVGSSVAVAAATGHFHNTPVQTAAVAVSSSEAASSSQIVSSMVESSSSPAISSTVAQSSAVSSAVSSTVSSKAAVQKPASKPAPTKKTNSVAPKTPSGGTAAKSTAGSTVKPSGGATGATANPQPPAPTNGVATNDAVANATWIVKNLGFYQSPNPSGAYYNPNNKAMSAATITVGHNNGTTYITFKVWGSNYDSIAKSLFKFYLPNSYLQLYNMVNDWDNGSDACSGKRYTLDGKSVIFYGYADAGQIDIQIGD